MPRKAPADKFVDELYEGFLVFPSWVGPAVGVVAYLALRFLIPALVGDEPLPAISGLITPLSMTLAPFVAGLVLVAWVVAEFRKWQRRRRFDNPTGLGTIRDLSWRQFEELVSEAYRRRGYSVQLTGSAGGDGGIDLILTRPGQRVLVQCKQWKAWKVGVRPVRELFGVMHSESATGGILVSSGRFTAEARRFAEGKAIELIAGPELWDLVQSVKAAAAPNPNRATVTVAASSAVGATKSSSSPAAQVSLSPACPKCGEPMLLRTAKRGPHPGSKFWGCPQYPQCRGTRELE